MGVYLCKVLENGGCSIFCKDFKAVKRLFSLATHLCQLSARTAMGDTGCVAVKLWSYDQVAGWAGPAVDGLLLPTQGGHHECVAEPPGQLSPWVEGSEGKSTRQLQRHREEFSSFPLAAGYVVVFTSWKSSFWAFSG